MSEVCPSHSHNLNCCLYCPLSNGSPAGTEYRESLFPLITLEKRNEAFEIIKLFTMRKVQKYDTTFTS